MDTTKLAIGEIVEVVLAGGDDYCGEGPVIEITSWGVKVKPNDMSPSWDYYGEKVYCFNRDGKECHEDGTPGGPWELVPPGTWRVEHGMKY